MKRSKSFTIQRKVRQQVKLKPAASTQKVPIQKKSTKTVESVPDAIMKHIKSRTDVEIIVHYEQYKEQFFLKCKRLQDYLCKYPATKEKYLQDNNHFTYGFQCLMLDLYHRGVIVPESYDNLRMDAVRQLQNWVLSWIQRKLLYEKASEEEKQQRRKVCSVLNELQRFVKVIEVEELPF